MYLNWGVRDRFKLFIESQQLGSSKHAIQISATNATWNRIEARITRQNHEPEDSGSSSGSPDLLCNGNDSELSFLLLYRKKSIQNTWITNILLYQHIFFCCHNKTFFFVINIISNFVQYTIISQRTPLVIKNLLSQQNMVFHDKHDFERILYFQLRYQKRRQFWSWRWYNCKFPITTKHFIS